MLQRGRTFCGEEAWPRCRSSPLSVPARASARPLGPTSPAAPLAHACMLRVTCQVVPHGNRAHMRGPPGSVQATARHEACLTQHVLLSTDCVVKAAVSSCPAKQGWPQQGPPWPAQTATQAPRKRGSHSNSTRACCRPSGLRAAGCASPPQGAARDEGAGSSVPAPAARATPSQRNHRAASDRVEASNVICRDGERCAGGVGLKQSVTVLVRPRPGSSSSSAETL